MSATLTKCGLCMEFGDNNMTKVESNPKYTPKQDVPCMETEERGMTMNGATLDRYGIKIYWSDIPQKLNNIYECTLVLILTTNSYSFIRFDEKTLEKIPAHLFISAYVFIRHLRVKTCN